VHISLTITCNCTQPPANHLQRNQYHRSCCKLATCNTPHDLLQLHCTLYTYRAREADRRRGRGEELSRRGVLWRRDRHVSCTVYGRSVRDYWHNIHCIYWVCWVR
jgi:hypothetical protein